MHVSCMHAFTTSTSCCYRIADCACPKNLAWLCDLTTNTTYSNACVAKCEILKAGTTTPNVVDGKCGEQRPSEFT